MISNHLSSQRGSSCRKPFSRQAAARYAATALAIAAVSFVSPLCPKPASAQTSGGVTAQLSFLQSLDNPIYLNINLLGQQLTNYGLTLGPNGNLFGTTATGGLLNQGSVYEVSPSGQIQLLHSFANSLTDGGTPSGSLTLGPDGNLYGVTKSGGADGDGTVYQVTPSGVVTTLYSFSGGATGALPTGTLSIGSDGTITGTTTAGGASNLGTVYQLANPATSPALTILHSFTGGSSDGSDPVSGVIQAANGDLYGTTTGGGAAADGTVFQIADNAGNAVESLVHSFAGGTGDGSDPVGGLIQTASGALAGTTAAGGANNLGTVYQVADAATQPVETVLQSFNGTNGGDPVSSLIQTANGTLLGTTMLGGANNQGTVFAALQSGTISTLESFTGNNSVVGSVLDETGDTPRVHLSKAQAIPSTARPTAQACTIPVPCTSLFCLRR